ncbi:MAG: hypothetical protein GF311_21450 [Candidatus Lokiarchaeota archaeon]|nr:hypothetical protein [Candidatus Lokiarchaeota archaeon]
MYQLQIENLGACFHFCSYGHMTECHYPYTCESEYCQHYRESREKKRKEIVTREGGP